MRARTLCAVRGCPDHATTGSRCERHQRRRPKAWLDVAAAAIARADGYCERCGRRARLSGHHVRPLVDGGDEIVSVDEVLALCVSCQAIERPQPQRRPNL